MKRIVTLGMVLSMTLSMIACTNSNESTAPNNESKLDSATESKSDSATEVIEMDTKVAAAMKAGECLSGSFYVLANDGSVITLTDSSDDGFAETYAKMPNVRKLSLTNVGTAVVALNDSGELYYLENKIAENVKDVAYCTTNTNVEAFCLLNHDVMRINSDDVLSEYTQNDKFKNIKTQEPIRGDLVHIEVDKHDFAVVNEQGEAFIYVGGMEEYYNALDYSEFEGMAFVDFAKVPDSSLTVAGLRRDGTTVAVGDYAEDILSWGKLVDLAMSDRMIVGLTADGKLKMTGEYAEMMGSIVERWSNIVAVEAGSAQVNHTGNIITAVDASGDFYFVSLSRPEDTTVSTAKISVENGKTGDRNCWKYTPDGKKYITADDGSWLDISDE